MDYKQQFIKNLEQSLINKFNNQQIQIITDQIIKELKDYEIIKGQYALMSYENINENILKRFCACLLIQGKSKNTIKQYKRTVEKLFEAIQKHCTQIGVYDIRFFLAQQKQRGVSNRTLENTRANLSAFYQWMVKEEIIVKNPCLNISPIKYIEKVRLPFSIVQIDKMRLACKNKKERAIFEMLLSTGVRVSQLVGIKISDIDMSNLSIHITNGKGAKERTVYMDELAKTHLLKYLDNRDQNLGVFLFYNKNNQPISAGGIRYILKAIAKRAQVENVHPHRFRRTFASNLANRGMDVQDIKKLLGHSDINTTMQYVYTSDNKIQNSYKRFIN